MTACEWKRMAAVVSIVFAGAIGCAQTAGKPAAQPAAAGQPSSARELNKAAAGKIFQEQLQKYGKDPDMLVLPGLLADRKNKRVALQAEATGLTVKGDPPEFFVIADNSGHDYEALSIAFAKPSDVHKALVFIGMESGRHVDFGKLQFWPKGERVRLSMSYKNAKEAVVGPFRMEKLFLDKKTGKPLDETGLVFTGSVVIDDKQNPGKSIYAADAADPNSVASNYNEPTTVLDVPRAAPQKESYNNLAVNPEFTLPEKALLEITIEPEYKDGKKRVVDLTLAASVKAGTAGADVSQVSFALTDKQGKKLNEQGDLNSVLAIFTALAKDGHDPFVSLQPDWKLTLKALHDLCAVLLTIDTEKGIRVEPPLGKDLYYRAFVPDPNFKDRAARFAQPWELRLSKKDSKVSGVLTEIKQTWKDQQIKPDLQVSDYAVPGPDALRKELDARGPGLGVILVFAPPAMTCQEVMDFVAPVRTTHSLIHVFTE